MKKILTALFMMLPVLCPAREVEIKILQTSDIHGNLFPGAFSSMATTKGGMSHIWSVVRENHDTYGDNMILLDNGDILQGDPSVYYSNYIDTTSTHVVAEVMNYLHYDAGNVGNHDIETGRKVLDRWANDCNMPILGANILDKATGEPHFKPYEIFERDGVRIAVLGLITPAIPVWLSEDIYEGLEFADMEETARKWIPVIKKQEKPHIIVGLFHAGQSGDIIGGYKENPTLELAKNVPGFDIILFGHDHLLENKKITNVNGDEVLLMNPANTGQAICEVTIKVELNDKGQMKKKSIEGQLTDVNLYEQSEKFLATFADWMERIYAFVSQPIGYFSEEVNSTNVFFGPSKLVDLIHRIQLDVTGADISFAAPISANATIPAGPILMNDMFKLYKYENSLYTIEMSGKEVKDYLEYSYGLWANQMASPADHLLLFKKHFSAGESMRSMLINPSYYFDSAAGIKYTVDVTKPAGEKITIESMANGSPFEMDKTYSVAVNSYRGNGGGDHFLKGAGISADELKTRIVKRSGKDLRSILAERIREKRNVHPQTLDAWRFIPEEYAREGIKRDKRLVSSRM